MQSWALPTLEISVFTPIPNKEMEDQRCHVWPKSHFWWLSQGTDPPLRAVSFSTASLRGSWAAEARAGTKVRAVSSRGGSMARAVGRWTLGQGSWALCLPFAACGQGPWQTRDREYFGCPWLGGGRIHHAGHGLGRALRGWEFAYIDLCGARWARPSCRDVVIRAGM